MCESHSECMAPIAEEFFICLIHINSNTGFVKTGIFGKNG
jgi:hypothetical protein